MESTAPFQGLPELVAYDEGLFEREGLAVEFADRDAGAGKRKTEAGVTSPHGFNPFTSHGRLFEQGQADMYNACEWGNYCRVQETGIKSRQLGRRAIIAYGAIVIPPILPVYTPQQLAHRTVGVPFYFGTHYLALHLLDGFVARDAIRVCHAPNGSRPRRASLLRGEVEATTLTEPYITLAEKKGCRTICSGFFHGTRSAPSGSTPRLIPRSTGRCAKPCGASTPTSARTCTTSFNYHGPDYPEIGALSI